MCERCGSVLGVSSDARQIVIGRGGKPMRLFVMDVASSQTTEILRHSTYRRYLPSLSPDGRWIAFGVEKGKGKRQIFVSPFRDGAAVSEDEWIEITNDSVSSRFNVWSPNGRMLYFISDRDGEGCVWAQAFDPESRRAVGSATPIHHFHGASLSTEGSTNLSVANDKLVLSISELTGNIWLAGPQSEP